MSAHRIAVRYAKSLLDLAIERGELDQVLHDMDQLKASLSSRDFYLMVKSPIISTGKKKVIFDRLFKDSLNKTVNSFLQIMVRKGRENLLPEIVDSFKEQYRTHKQISPVMLTTAVALDEKTIAQIKEKLIQSGQTEKNVELLVKVDPSLIGGFRLEFEGKEYNTSLAYRLEEMRKQFSTN
ncbi:MAG: ATP synthase F1 subunit delta [Saprospiraceae bacterium]|nr:ATP synthase F1 subunit delta [Saprospiraceae bacterium]